MYLQEYESKVTDQSGDMVELRSELRHLQQELEAAKSLSITFEKDLEKAREDKIHAEQRMTESSRRLEEAEHKRKGAERDAKRAIEAAEKARNEATTEEKEKLETQRLAAERLATVERTQRRCESLEQEREELTQVRTLVAMSVWHELSG